MMKNVKWGLGFGEGVSVWGTMHDLKLFYALSVCVSYKHCKLLSPPTCCNQNDVLPQNRPRNLHAIK